MGFSEVPPPVQSMTRPPSVISEFYFLFSRSPLKIVRLLARGPLSTHAQPARSCEWPGPDLGNFVAWPARSLICRPSSGPSNSLIHGSSRPQTRPPSKGVGSCDIRCNSTPSHIVSSSVGTGVTKWSVLLRFIAWSVLLFLITACPSLPGGWIKGWIQVNGRMDITAGSDNTSETRR